MTSFVFGSLVSILSLVGLVLVVMAILHRIHHAIGIAITLLAAAAYGTFVFNGLQSGTPMTHPIGAVPALLATVAIAGGVGWLFRGGHGHSAIDTRWRAVGVVVAIILLIGIWWGPVQAMNAPQTFAVPGPIQDVNGNHFFDPQRDCARGTKRLREMLECDKLGL